MYKNKILNVYKNKNSFKKMNKRFAHLNRVYIYAKIQLVFDHQLVLPNSFFSNLT